MGLFELNVDKKISIKIIKSGQMNHESIIIDVRYYYVSEQFHQGLLDIKYCCSENQLADVGLFTKPLLGSKFQKFKSILLKNCHYLK